MLNISDLSVGTFLVFNGAPHQVIWEEHAKLGRGGAILRIKIKNLLNGAIVDTTFKGSEKLESADITREKAQFLYKDASGFHFMDNSNFEQFNLSSAQVGQAGGFLKESMEIDVLSWNGKAINISPPIKVDLVVAETDPAVRGNTAQGSVSKPAILETGAKLQVPIFINIGDIIKVNTQTGEYVERVTKK
jgi:elongation factor P